ncbi:MAG: inositol monophosphatase family protein [Candidatus Neomarinimicrobiota bacterium]
MNDLIKLTAVKAVVNASRLIMDAYNQPRKISYKGSTDLVTDTDHASERLIINTIQSKFPDHGILAEESGAIHSSSPYSWIIDPLDGTTNFVHRYPSFGVSVGVLYKGLPIVGVVGELPSQNLYVAVKDEGAVCNGEKIKVSTVGQLQDALLVTGFGYQHGEKWEANMGLFKLLVDLTQGVRRLGAAAIDLCHVAAGFADGFWEFDLHPWDSAAGVLIISEAGGIVTGMDGNPCTPDDLHILASNPNLHRELVKYTSPVIDDLRKQGISLISN